MCTGYRSLGPIWKNETKKLYELWNGDISKNPMTDYTIGIDTPRKNGGQAERKALAYL